MRCAHWHKPAVSNLAIQPSQLPLRVLLLPKSILWLKKPPIYTLPAGSAIPVIYALLSAGCINFDHSQFWACVILVFSNRVVINIFFNFYLSNLAEYKTLSTSAFTI